MRKKSFPEINALTFKMAVNDVMNTLSLYFRRSDLSFACNLRSGTFKQLYPSSSCLELKIVSTDDVLLPENCIFGCKLSV